MRKNIHFLIIGLLSFPLILVAQATGVGIGTNNPHPSAILELDTTKQPALANKGLLLPRLTENQRNSISSPATGLLIYNNEAFTLDYFSGVRWLGILASNLPVVRMLRCDQAVMVPAPTLGQVGYSGVIVVPYTSGNQQSGFATLTASAGTIGTGGPVAYTLNSGDGVLRFNVSGNAPVLPNNIIHFDLIVNDKRCHIVQPLNP